MTVTESDNTAPFEPPQLDTETPLSKDQLFHILQNRRRRDVLWYLRGTEGSVRMRDIAEQVAAWENDTTVEALMSDQRQRVYIALYQEHLPKLDEDGVIDYNKSRGIVERNDVADQFDPYLTNEIVEEATPSGPATPGVQASEPASWQKYSVGVSGIGALALLGITFDAPVLGESGTLAVGIIAVILAMVTLAYALSGYSQAIPSANGNGE
ncbi:hypothetical protein AUR64_19360 [Haloprofundus marisrubri]|uniref:DUF7344 domain-containing protein n=1 Tax=Haloprofundus marisrubri TaxID=1514971 RepID=A0A0W1R565_9EURY|nr:DUF202 domain-containing protein [Haloprofundus marisrubri]KTG08391.1 hypothetical protein AUR64_19360 [Haloprofundus marisrubri]